VGVNDFVEGNDDDDLSILRVTNADEQEQIRRLERVRRDRDDHRAALAIERLENEAADSEVNLMPALINAAQEYVTVGEMMSAMADVFGRYVEVPSL